MAVVNGYGSVTHFLGVVGGGEGNVSHLAAGGAVADADPVAFGNLGGPVLVGIDVDGVVATCLDHFLIQVFIGNGKEGDTLLTDGDLLTNPVFALDGDNVLAVVQEGIVVVLYADGGNGGAANMEGVGVNGLTLFLAYHAPVRVLAVDDPRIRGCHQDGESRRVGGRQVIAVVHPVAQVYRFNVLLPRVLLAAREGGCQKSCGCTEYVY